MVRSDPEFAIQILTLSETKFARAFLKSVLFSAINLTMPDFHRIIKTEYDISGLDRSLIDGHPQLGLLTADTGAGKISNLQQNLERNQETQAYRSRSEVFSELKYRNGRH